MDHARNFGDKQRGRYARTLLPVRGRPPAWRWFSNLRVHGTFLSRVPVRHATVLMPSPIIPISCPRGREPDAPGEREKLGTGKSRVPADKNVGATTSAFASMPRPRRPFSEEIAPWPGVRVKLVVKPCQTISNHFS